MSTPTRRTRRRHVFADFYDLMMKHFPHLRNEREMLDVYELASLLECSAETVYVALREEVCIQPKFALRLLELSHSNQFAKPLYWSQIAQFVLPEFEKYERPSRGSRVSRADLLS